MLTAKSIKEKAMELGASLVGIGDISLFEGTILQRDPRQILPNAKCVIGVAFRVPSALYDTMHDKTQFFTYTQMGVKYIDEELSEILLLKMGAFIENEGYDACLQRNVSNLKIKGDKTTNPEVVGTYELVFVESVGSGKPAPEIIMDFNQAGKICGLGDAGMSGHFLTKEFGPYVRLLFIVTDAPLECDKPFDGQICDRCGKCVSACPGYAISPDGGLDTWQCSVYYRGAHKSNPFMTDEFLKGDPEREDIVNGRKRFDAESAKAIYPKLNFLPCRPTCYSPCICGKACDYVCHEHLTKK